MKVKVSDDYIWDMFKRHKWSKKVPRQSHPQADKAAQEEFKKTPGKFGSQIVRVCKSGR